RRCRASHRLAAAGVTRAHRPALSRSMAEAPALEAALHPGRKLICARAHSASGRRIAFRDRYRRLRGVGARARPALARFHLDGGARRRLAAALERLRADALRSQSDARRPRPELYDFSQALNARRYSVP